MKILLCAATEMEIGPTIHFLTTNQQYSIDILITGVGLTASTYALTKALLSSPPSLVLQAGLAGTLDQELPLSSVVAVRNETFGDMGVYEDDNFQSLFSMGFSNPNVYPFTDGRLSNTNSIINQCGMLVVNGVTVNEVSTDTKRISYYQKQLGAQVETMEGAALHYVCLLEKIPFLQVRALSNFIGERDKSKWKMDKAVSNLNQEVQRIFSKIKLT